MFKEDALAWGGGVRPLARKMTAAGYPMSGSVVSQWPDPIPELAARRIWEVSAGDVPLYLEEHYRNQTQGTRMREKAAERT